MKVIIKKPEDKYGNIVDIKNELEVMQEIVGGYIEVVPLGKHVIICNEDGKYMNLKDNVIYGTDIIVGNIIVCNIIDDEFTDIDITIDEWQNILNGKNLKD